LKELIEHIENLLPEHDCVVVPGLGGFVQNEVPAHIDSANDLFYPASKGIGFNARLTFNDGLLAQAYQQTYHISFEEANIKIHKDLQELNDSLNEGKFVSLGNMGRIRKNEQGQIVFHPDNKNLYFPESFGLTSFSYPSLKVRQENKIRKELLIKKRKEDEFIHIRMRRRSFQNLTIGAAACLFMLLLSKPVGTLPNGNYQEAFMMHDYLVTPESVQQNTPEIQAAPSKSAIMPAANEYREAEKQRRKTEVKNTENTELGSLSTSKALDRNAKTSDFKSKRNYYIVVSSFPEKEPAQEWLRTKRHHALFSSAGVIERDGHSRVYIRKFRVKKEAEAFLTKFRADNDVYASAWLFSAKND
jgi:hypothetical protein